MIEEAFEIDNRVYRSVKLGVFRAVPVHAKVIKAMGSGLSAALANIDRNQSKESMVLAVASALTQMDTVTIAEMMPEMITEITYNKERLLPQKAEQHFSDFPQDLYPVFFWVLAINIVPFLEGGGQGWKALMKHLGSLSLPGGRKNG